MCRVLKKAKDRTPIFLSETWNQSETETVSNKPILGINVKNRFVISVVRCHIGFRGSWPCPGPINKARIDGALLTANTNRCQLHV